MNRRFALSHSSRSSFMRIASMPSSTISVSAPPYSNGEQGGVPPGPSLHARIQSPSWPSVTRRSFLGGRLYSCMRFSGMRRTPSAPCEPCRILPFSPISSAPLPGSARPGSSSGGTGGRSRPSYQVSFTGGRLPRAGNS